MESQKEKEIMIRAIITYNEHAQIDMAVEDCSELIKALMKYKRNRNSETHYNIVDVAADVSIMLDQIKLMLSCDLLFDKIRNEKLMRLEKRLDDRKNQKS